MAAGAWGGRRPVLAVEGARQLRTSLKRAGQDVGELKDVHRKAADIVADRAKANPPDHPADDDGVHIVDTIRPGATRTQAIVRAGNNAKADYAPTLHYGDKRASHPRTEAQPFLTDAAHDSESQWLPEYERHVTGIIQRIEGL